MTDPNKEQLSAFMDGEANSIPATLLAAADDDAAGQGAWSRYHLISACLQRRPNLSGSDASGRYAAALHGRVAQAVSKALAHEPAILAPVKTAKTATPRKRVMTAMLRPAAGFAIAASVALAAILTVQQSADDATHHVNNVDNVLAAADPVIDNPAPAVPEDPIPEGSTIAPPWQRAAAIPLRQVSAGDAHDSRTLRPYAKHPEWFNRYLINHNERRAGAGVHGVLPYVRVVADDGR